MPLFSRLIFATVDWAARKGLREPNSASGPARKQQARETGIRGETYAYWYLRSHGYIFVAKNYTASGIKGEIDLVGYDGPTLAFVEVRTRTEDKEGGSTPEESVTREKRRLLARMAQRFLAQRRFAECPFRFDVLAIENRPGQRPAVRLHKGAFGGG